MTDFPPFKDAPYNQSLYPNSPSGLKLKQKSVTKVDVRALPFRQLHKAVIFRASLALTILNDGP